MGLYLIIFATMRFFGRSVLVQVFETWTEMRNDLGMYPV